MPETLLTTTEVAARFDVSSETVRRWVDKGYIKARRVPGGWMKFRLEDVEALLRPNDVA